MLVGALAALLLTADVFFNVGVARTALVSSLDVAQHALRGAVVEASSTPLTASPSATRSADTLTPTPSATRSADTLSPTPSGSVAPWCVPPSAEHTGPIPVRESVAAPPGGGLNPHAGSALWIRAYAGKEGMLDEVLLRGLRGYWPPRRFGRVYLVLDAGAGKDEAMAKRLIRKYGGSELVREGGSGGWSRRENCAPADHTPAADTWNHTEAAPEGRNHMDDPLISVTYATCGGWGFCYPSRGYYRQQVDTINADLYVPERYPGAHPDEPPNAVIGVADVDAMLVTLPHEHTFFDEAGRPRVIPRVQLPFGELWSNAAVATQWLLGVPEPFRGMNYFPVYIKRPHFAALRAHCARVHNGTAIERLFDDLFARGILYSNFNILLAYIWHFHREEYAWHYFVPDGFNPADLLTHTMPGVGHDYAFLNATNATLPYPRIMTHWFHARSRRPADEHMANGLCHATAGAADVCAHRPGWADRTEDMDMWDFEMAHNSGPLVAAGQIEYYRAVKGEIARGLWPIGAVGAYVSELRAARFAAGRGGE